ncbi:hypothetical protein NEUTE2DRAFT_129208 [Neurospora tetrasperma FGSC 2509]|nr:hypothetical protein NEUTE2DRAFT_129208 [Neurospora tetrasperma FGSC 2509]
MKLRHIPHHRHPVLRAASFGFDASGSGGGCCPRGGLADVMFCTLPLSLQSGDADVYHLEV